MPRYVPRVLDLENLLQHKSHFLFGPRQTGKTSLVRHTLKGAQIYNLLESDTFLSLSREPQRLRQEVKDPSRVVVIDEIQKLPGLLDEVQWLIEERGIRFLLTGSSARTLRRGGVNLLGGRARSRTLHPLVSPELGEVDLTRALAFGTMPSIYFSDNPREDLRSYTGDYLREEIAHEGLTRRIPAFSRFLEVAALCNGKMLNFSEIASDAQVPRTTVHEYFAILKDTLIGYELEAWGRTKSRKPIVTSKLYFFDVGVARSLQGRGALDEKSADFGEAFEAWLFHELLSWVHYHGDGDLKYWRTTSGFEVDFVLNERVGIEVKSTRRVAQRDLKGLKALQEETGIRAAIVVSCEPRPREVDGIEILPWEQFLERLWSNEYAA
jgi:predicted AAA+ superfamily ATPase